MQYYEAEQLRKEWQGKPCSHENVEKEYHLGSHTGDYVCTICGQEFAGRQEAERTRQRILEASESSNDSQVLPDVPESHR
ncbi:MAG: hypothetical protein JXM70_25315 [Pirellulales bacterium]|nr:hypothetical protein [Pirellulales bacterium]